MIVGYRINGIELSPSYEFENLARLYVVSVPAPSSTSTGTHVHSASPEGTPSTCNGRSSPYWILPVAIILTLVLALAYYRKTKRGEKEKDKGP
ncbi:hypothetical protein [Thermococcus celer]|uniref:Uncharacterized protein n=1 Tax=Thermococcus celer Vu 13 = JCM 8558 TaxID=1293037 RepID=A0A218P017_THECE|nr:hypothetical protein [Thermococcus celer]ASI98277.1 hypothetical protein A3L02_01175 [Thermococcus celer Vu 13 = JCM 8558]